MLQIEKTKHEFVRSSGVDPAMLAFEGYRTAHELCSIVNPEGDCPDELVDASLAAFKQLMSTRPTTLAGIAAKLQAAILQYGDHSLIPLEALEVPLGDLDRLLPAQPRTSA